MKPASAHAILFETPAHFAAPFRFCIGLMLSVADRDGLRDAALIDERSVTKRACIGVLEQEGTTLRAYLYHWSVLRCGSSSEERRNGSTM
jgi:hypothetical protein